MPGRSPVALVLLTVLLGSRAASAQPRDAPTAEALFRAGRQAVDAKDFKAACPKFAESYRLDPAVGTLLNLANCEEKIGHVADASTHFRRVLEQLPPGDNRAPVASARIAAIAPRLPYLVLQIDPASPRGVTVTRDGIELGAAAVGVALPVNPGDHEVVVSAPGHEERRERLTLAEGERRELVLHAGPASAPPPPLAPPAPGPQRTIGFVLGGVGVASLGAGIVTGALTLAKASTVKDPAHCVALRCDPVGVDAARAGETLSVVSTVTLAASAALAAAGVVLVLTSRRAPPVTAGLLWAPGGAGLQLGSAW